MGVPAGAVLAAETTVSFWEQPATWAAVATLASALITNATQVHLKNKELRVSMPTGATNRWKTATVVLFIVTCGLAGYAWLQSRNDEGVATTPETTAAVGAPSPTPPSGASATTAPPLQQQLPTTTTTLVPSAAGLPSLDEAEDLLLRFLRAGGAGEYELAWTLVGAPERDAPEWGASGSVGAPPNFIAFWEAIEDVGPSDLDLENVTPDGSGALVVRTVLVWDRTEGSTTSEVGDFTVSHDPTGALVISEWSFVCIEGGTNCPG